MRSFLCFLLSFVVVGYGHAMSVSGYEKALRMADASGPDRFIAKATIEAYFQGIAETLEFLQTGTQHVYFRDQKLLCFPSPSPISASLLRGILDGELRKPDVVVNAFGADWKEYQVATVLLPLVARLFPWPK